MITRILTDSDRGACQLLWADRFSDGEPFIDWFFQNRFSPKHSAGTFHDGKLVSMSLGYPMRLTSPHGDVPAWMLSGISTVSGFERQGLMHRTVRFQMQAAHSCDVPVVFNHPVRLHQYDSLGFRPITDTLLYEGTGIAVSPGNTVTCTPDLTDMFTLYAGLAARCYGFVDRDAASFDLKMRDYLVDGAQLYGLCELGRLTAYAVVFANKDELFAEEVVASGSYARVLQMLSAIASGRRVKAKLPPFADVQGRIFPQNVAAFTRLDDGCDIQEFFGYPSPNRICYAIDEY